MKPKATAAATAPNTEAEMAYAVAVGSQPNATPEQKQAAAVARQAIQTLKPPKPVAGVNYRDESSFRDDFDKQPEVKAHREVARYVQSAREAYALSKDAKSKNAADQALVTSLNKILDPGSVVRESEYARTAEGQSILNRLGGYLSRALSGGGGFTDAERKEVLDMVNRLGDGSQKLFDATADEFEASGRQYGFDTKRTIRRTNIAPAGGSGSSKTVEDVKKKYGITY